MLDRRSGRIARRHVSLVLAIAVAGLWTVGWAWACRRLEVGAREALGGAGWSLDGQPAHWGGWPLAAAVGIDGATLRSGPETVPPLTAFIGRLTWRIAATAPTRLIVDAAGPGHVTVGAGPPIAFAAEQLCAMTDLRGSAPPRVIATGLRIGAAEPSLLVGHGTLDLLADGWSARLEGVTPSDMAGRSIDPAISSLQLDGRVTPAVRAMADAAASARDWRARGGRVSLSMPALRWGGLEASGQASVSLDAALQPVADGTLSSTGLVDGLRQLAANGVVTPTAARAAAAMLTILAAPAAGGTVTLPLRLEEGVLSVARFPLLRLAPVQWD